MADFNQEYGAFIETITERCSELGTDISKFTIDHACYRASSLESYLEIFKELKTISILYTSKHFHERKFHSFFLKSPLVHKGISSYLIEFAEPGGSDNYQTGFQHLELQSKLSLYDLFPKLTEHPELLFEGKFGDEKYLKWNDKLVVKIKTVPLSYEATAEDGSEVFINN